MTDDAWARALLEPQPAPRPGRDSVTDAALAASTDHRVRLLLAHRREQGRARYGTELQSHNGRWVAADRVQEMVDELAYATQMRLEGSDIDGAADTELRLIGLLDHLGWSRG